MNKLSKSNQQLLKEAKQLRDHMLQACNARFDAYCVHYHRLRQAITSLEAQKSYRSDSDFCVKNLKWAVSDCQSFLNGWNEKDESDWLNYR